MLKAILFPLRTILSIFFTVTMLMGCEADTDTEEPIPVSAETKTTFSLVDSIKVDEFFKTTYSDAYQNLNGKTYKVHAQNKLEVYYFEDNSGVTLYFRDTSTVNARSWVSLFLKNYTLQNLPATLSLKNATAVGVQNGQTFGDGSGAMSPGYITVLDGTIALSYNNSTKLMSGTITNLKFGLEYFVPEYSFPNRAGNALKSSGSSRTLNITFENMQKLKV